jgi:protein-S-isoprenylcysteine O-methyltransferase Ste14
MVMPTLRLTLIVVGTAAYYGLAVIGGGGLAPFFSHPALIALAVVVFVMAGVALFAAGGALRLWPVFVLGYRFSGLVAIQPQHGLVTSGVYGVIRHPSYLGLLVNSLGWGLAFRSGVGILLTALMIPALLARIRAEERLLRAQFGEEYGAFCARTSRLIPRVY